MRKVVLLLRFPPGRMLSRAVQVAFRGPATCLSYTGDIHTYRAMHAMHFRQCIYTRVFTSCSTVRPLRVDSNVGVEH